MVVFWFYGYFSFWFYVLFCCVLVFFSFFLGGRGIVFWFGLGLVFLN